MRAERRPSVLSVNPIAREGPTKLEKLSPCGLIILGMEHAQCPKRARHLALGTGSAEARIGRPAGLSASEMGDEISPPGAREKRKKKKGLTSLERRFGDRASASDARSILTTGDTEEYRETQRNTGKITELTTSNDEA